MHTNEGKKPIRFSRYLPSEFPVSHQTIMEVLEP